MWPATSDTATRRIPSATCAKASVSAMPAISCAMPTTASRSATASGCSRCLDEQGRLPLTACMHVIRDGRDPIGTIAAMALRRFVEIDLDKARIGPETRVSRFHD